MTYKNAHIIPGKTYVKIYAFLKENNSLPPEKYEFSDKKLKGLTLLKTLLEKKKAKRFFAFGFIFLAFSYFVPIKVYYVVFGCAFLIFALFLTIFGQTENN